MKSQAAPFMLSASVLFGVIALPAMAQPAPAPKGAVPTKATPAATKTSPAPEPPPVVLPPAPMKPGLWEVAVFTDVAGAPTKQNSVRRICYTKEVVATPQQLLPPQQEVGMICTTSDYTLSGAVATWELACKTKDGTLFGPGKVTMGAEHYSGYATLTLNQGKTNTKVTQGFGGKRLGDC
jgi:hypothetical protein